MKKLAPTLEYDLKLTSNLAPVERAKHVKVPTHIVYGSKSPESMHLVAQQLGKVMPNSSVFKLDGEDHRVSPKVLLPILARYFLAT